MEPDTLPDKSTELQGDSMQGISEKAGVLEGRRSERGASSLSRLLAHRRARLFLLTTETADCY